MKKIFGIFIALFLSVGAYAQILTPVKWSYAAKKVNDKEAVVYLKATIEPGWHIYSQTVAEGGPIKTSFDFAQSKAFSLVGKTIEPKPKNKFDNTFNMDVPYFEKSVVFQQKVKLNSASADVKGVLEFMVCNDHQCLPPQQVEFSIPVS